MITMTVSEIATVVGGHLNAATGAELVTGPAFIDTRKPEPGGLFAAFVGEHTDGHEFAAAAIAGGAVAVLATRATGQPSILVTDVGQALTRLATAHAVRLLRAKTSIIGITGSAGKTSTKDLLSQILEAGGPTVATAGSYNNEIGLPLTITRAEPDVTKFLVLEMGASHIGDIDHLTAIAPPNIGIVLNVGTAHVGEFGGQGNIAKAKSEMVQALPSDGVAILNEDDPRVAAMADLTAARVITFGQRESADVTAESVQVDEKGAASFVLRTPGGTGNVHLNLLGVHQVNNALAAAAAAWALGLDTYTITKRLTAALPLTGGRLQIVPRGDGVTVVNDAFNANPASVAAAIETLASIEAKRRILVLGEMAELGDLTDEAHTNAGIQAARTAITDLVTVGGELAQRIADSARSVRPAMNVTTFPDAATTQRALEGQLRAGDVVLIKASHAARLDRLAEALTARV